MNKYDDVWVAEIAARAEAASGDYDSNDRSSHLYFGREWHYDLNPADVRFIAHAREDIPFLLSEVRRLRSVVEDAERVIAERDAVIERVAHEMRRGGVGPMGQMIDVTDQKAMDETIEAVVRRSERVRAILSSAPDPSDWLARVKAEAAATALEEAATNIRDFHSEYSAAELLFVRAAELRVVSDQ